MQETSYSTGPKFFGTTTKSTFHFTKSLGSIREIGALQVQVLMTLSGSIIKILQLGHSQKTPREILFSRSIIDSTPNRIDIK